MIRAMMGRRKVDKDTELLLHFNGDLKDSSKNRYVVTSSGQFRDGKFGQSFGLSDIVMPKGVFSNLILHDFTIDYWFKVVGENEGHNVLLGFGGNTGMLYSAVRVNCSRNGGSVYLEYNTGNSHGSIYEYRATLSDSFHHVAFVRNGNRFMLFIDGSKVIDVQNNNCSVLGSDRVQNIITWDARTLFDEFRISNIARWTGNFTPPTKPY